MYFKIIYLFTHVQSHAGYFPGVLMIIPDWQSWNHHISVTNCLHLSMNEKRGRMQDYRGIFGAAELSSFPILTATQSVVPIVTS